ncbi:MAG: hypothetical protein GEU83_13900 [Pseudonocardiaceae bacterium]|nr:hypothetical protein [Pseudonocardiaceae bacterium]
MAKRMYAVAGLLAPLLAVAACGSSQADKPVDQIVSEARTAANEASSVRVTGDLAQGPTKGKVDLLLTNNGDGREDLTLAGQTISVVKVGDAVYAKGIPGQPGGGFQQLPADNPVAGQLVQDLNKKTLFDELLNPQQRFTKAGTGQIDDQDVVKLKPQQGQAMYYISDDSDNPYPLRVETSGQQGGLTLTLADWDAGATVEPPRTGGP